MAARGDASQREGPPRARRIATTGDVERYHMATYFPHLQQMSRVLCNQRLSEPPARLTQDPMLRLLRTLVAGLALTLAPVACSRPASPVDAATADLAMANTMLEGDWHLAGFKPDTPFEPSLSSLLDLQVRTMTVRFDGQHMTGTSPTIHLQRTYRVTQATASHFTLVATDDLGVATEIVAEFQGPNQIAFRSKGTPWAGNGVLIRGAPLSPVSP